MDFYNLWNQFLLNTTICLQTNPSTVNEGLQIVNHYFSSSDTNSSISSESCAVYQAKDNEESNDDNESEEKIDECVNNEEAINEIETEEKNLQKKSIQRIRLEKRYQSIENFYSVFLDTVKKNINVHNAHILVQPKKHFCIIYDGVIVKIPIQINIYFLVQSVAKTEKMKKLWLFT